MTQTPTGPAAFGQGDSISGAMPRQAAGAPASTRPARGRRQQAARSRRLPGGRVVAVATLVVVVVALFEVLERNRIGEWTGLTLIAVSAVAVLVTRPGDRSLPAMMPPLAFVAAVALAGQRLVNSGIDDPWQRQAVMVVETLGANAVWVVVATAVAVLLALLGHLLSRRRRRRAASAEATATGSG